MPRHGSNQDVLQEYMEKYTVVYSDIGILSVIGYQAMKDMEETEMQMKSI